MEKPKRKFTEEHLKKLSEAHKGKPSHRKGKKLSKEHIKNLVAGGFSMKGKNHTKETKAKISNAHKGRIISKEWRKKISKANKGKITSDSTKEKLSRAIKKYWKSLKNQNKNGSQES